MLSRAYRTIFVHIPKTGGQSIETVFLKAHGLTWETRAPLLLRSNTDPAKGPRRLAHLYASEYVSRGHVSAEDFEAFFRFAVVRNPWARAVSSYKYALQPTGMPFGVFIREVIGEGRHLVELRQIDLQTRYLRSDDGALLVNTILRFENLAAEFAAVSRQIFAREEQLPAVNVSADRSDYRAFYDEESRKLVAEKYRDDIETFGYQFDDGS